MEWGYSVACILYEWERVLEVALIAPFIARRRVVAIEVHGDTLPVRRTEELHHALSEGTHLFVREVAIR